MPLPSCVPGGFCTCLSQSPVFQSANPGLAFDYQFIDVPDFKGRGESEPAPYYFQNLGEAE